MIDLPVGGMRPFLATNLSKCQFTHLGSVVLSLENIDADVAHRIKADWARQRVG